MHARLAEVWANGPGLAGQLTAVNHTTLGYRFMATGFVFLLLGGMLAMFMRTQLAWSGNDVLDHEAYNRFVTMHGTTMMFLFAIPVLEGIALFLLPKMLGTRDVPYPRLTAFGYWSYLFGGVLLYSSFLFGEVPDAGWFMYTPLSSKPYSPGPGVDFWLLGVTFAEIAALTAAVELIVAVLKTRAPGMSVQRMPLFAWYILVTAFMIAFGFPPLILGSVLLEVERAFDFAFFDPSRGGDPLLWQHLFWLFGHPEVYIIFLPAAGMISMMLPAFARRPIVGYTWIVLALIATGFLSFGLWVHHMFTVGIPLLALSFFSAASMAVAIPMGIQVFAWIATLWAGRPDVRVPMLFLCGFFFIFVLGGLTGIMVALVPFDWQVHDTHFVVAHFHYVLIGGMLFPLMAAAYYWLPLLSGRQPSEHTGRTAFWLLFAGFNITFLPMHLTGLLGLPRRVYTYSPELGLDWLNLVSTAGGFVFAIGVTAFLVDVLVHFAIGRRSSANPWRAGTLEWAMPMPPPNYNFASIPVVGGRDPLWEEPDLPDRIDRGEQLLAGADRGRRELLGTSVLSARPEYVLRLSSSSWLPITTAAAIGLVLSLFLLGWYAAAAVTVLAPVVAMLAWAWTTGDPHARGGIAVGRGLVLPLHHETRQAPGWWGTVLAVLIDGSLFASLLFGYVYLWLGAPAWPPGEVGLPGLAWPATAAALLLASSVAMRRAHRGLQLGLRVGPPLLLALALALAFALVQAGSLVGAPVPQAHAYGSIVHTMLGFQLLHVLVAMLMAAFALARLRAGLLDAQRSLSLEVAALWWHYTVVQGLIVLVIVHLFPRAL